MSTNPRDGSYNIPGDEGSDHFNDLPKTAPRNVRGPFGGNSNANPLPSSERENWRDDFKEPQK
jgi:hypothetical protein